MKRIFTFLLVLVLFAAIAISLASVYVYFVATNAPEDFVTDQFVEIQQGSTLGSIAEILEEKNIISSAPLFKLGVYLTGKQEQLKSGTYFFSEPLRMEDVVKKTINGSFELPTKRVTTLEGQAAYAYAGVIAQALPEVDEQTLLKVIADQKKEGYLYPDTYFFPENATEQEVIAIMEKNFNKNCLLYTSPSPRDATLSRMPSSA